MTSIFTKEKRLEDILDDLAFCHTMDEKISFFSSLEEVQDFFQRRRGFKEVIQAISKKQLIIFFSFLATGQGESLFKIENSITEEQLVKFISNLEEVESFYRQLGGIIGYQRIARDLLLQKIPTYESVDFSPPKGIDISQRTDEVKKAIFYGIMKLDSLAEIYPVGGAGDRLNLIDEEGKALPAARLPFLGYTLLEGLIRDLQAREYLHYKLFGVQLVTPIALMTSSEKENHAQILSICRENQFFGRPRESIFLFSQFLVPVFTEEGKWCWEDEFSLLCKPGGHGVIWKLALEKGGFQWLKSLGRKKLLVRQINNPIAGCDYGLSAFTGIGFLQDMSFGFASCPRQVGAKEGMNGLKNGILTCIEYCDFEKYNIQDLPEKKGGKYSRFPSNTNILFADIVDLEKAARNQPFPNFIANFKDGLARLESTMQNIAESKIIASKEKSYLTYNRREKTISVAKKHRQNEGSYLETVEGCFFDYLRNAADLLSNHCQTSIPTWPESYSEIPPFIFLYHPSLGPLYSIVAQKIRGGKLHKGAEMQLEIAELLMENLELRGSLCIRANQIMGHQDEQKHLCFSEKVGRCLLKNVKVHNEGINFDANNEYWKNQVVRKEMLSIILEGNSCFIAENVTFTGNESIFVPDGKQMRAIQRKEGVFYEIAPISESTLFWNYDLKNHFDIKLSWQPSDCHD